MNQVRTVVRLVAFFVTGCAFAGPVEDAIVAIMRLSEQPNYTWVATVADDARTYEIDGKTTQGGFSHVRMPAINSVRRRLGREAMDNRVEAIFLGNVHCVLRTEQGWLRPDELPEPEAVADFDRLAMATLPGSIIPPSSRVIVMNGSAIRRPKLSGPPDQEKRGYSNLQLAISPPHEELGVIVGSHRDFKVEGDVVTGTLTDLGAQLLLVRDGQKEITPLQASGDFKIWLRGGLVTRYQVRLDGTLSVLTAKSGRVTVLVQQRTTTVLTEVGSTRVEIPEHALAKLAAR